MDKIYSMHRLPKILVFSGGSGGKLNRQKKIIIVMITIMVIGYFTSIKIIRLMIPFIERQCRVVSRSTAIKYSNESCKKIMEKIEYEDLCTIERDKNGKIILIKMNSVNVSKLNNEIALDIQKKFDTGESGKFYISLGTFTGNQLLVGRGPKVEVKMSTIGEVTTKIKSEFTNTGINQTLHRIYIDIHCNVSLITPFKDVDEQIDTQVLLAETVIAGEIPDTYYSLDGITKDNLVDTIK